MKKFTFILFGLSLLVFFLNRCTDIDSGHKVLYMKVNNTEVALFQTNQQKLAFKIERDNQMVLDTSFLGIVLNDKTLGVNSKIKLLKSNKLDFSYSVFGIKNKASYKAEEFIYEVSESDGFQWQLHFQISDEGVAYRYFVESDGIQKVISELSTFHIPPKSKVWYFERDSDWKLKSHAGEWRSADISEMLNVSKMGPVQGLTLTCELPSGEFLLLAEAALYNYSGMRLEAIANNTFQANFTEGKLGFEITGNVLTPWRCVLFAENLNALVNNTMVSSLNPAPSETLFKDRSWIKPGKSVWHWWSGKHVDFDEEMAMIDDASSLNFQYSMIDEGWEKWEGKWGKISELSAYAKAKQIGIFVWKHSKEINNPINDYAVMEKFLDSVKETGALGIKVDFMNGQTKSIIDFNEAVLRKSAERQLMVNFHGCNQSSGEYRTYPNEVTREGIRGLEVNHMKEGPLPASHNAALPFTRYVTGHADYTPIGFTEPGETTWAHQLGTLVTFYSPFNCIAENTQFLLNNKSVAPALKFIKEVPTVWDETLVLPQSKIGELAIIARRKGTNWYMGILSSGKEKEISIDVNFLENGFYNAEVFLDDSNAKPIDLKGLNKEANLRQWHTATPFKKESLEVSKSSEIKINLAENGGAVFHFVKIE